MPDLTMEVSLEEFGKKAAEFALDEITYNDLTIRQWADKIASGEFQPVRHGLWKDNGEDKWICSACKGYVWRWFGKQNFCPNCGAKMGGDENAAD